MRGNSKQAKRTVNLEGIIGKEKYIRKGTFIKSGRVKGRPILKFRGK